MVAVFACLRINTVRRLQINLV